MYELESAIRDAIDYHLLGTQYVLADGHQGDDTIVVGSTRGLSEGDEIALYSGVCDGTQIEVVTVCQVLDHQRIRIHPPLAADWRKSVVSDDVISIHSTIQKLHEGEFIQYVVQGNPPSIPRYPAITVECLGNENDALTLGVIGQEFRIRIGVWGEKSTYATTRRQVQKLASRIELALFRTVFPLVNPWAETTLAEDMEPEQNLITVENGAALAAVDVLYGEKFSAPLPVYIESFDGRYPTQLVAQAGENSFIIDRVYSTRFLAGITRIIRPRVHIYDSFCDGISIAENRDNLLYADVSYRAKLARLRFGLPYVG